MTNGGDRTADFSAALESASATPAAESSPDSTPATSTPDSAPTGETPAAATAQPETETTPPVTATAEESKKEPPAWRWQDILENTRKTVAQETEERLKREFEQQTAGLQDFQAMSAEERAGLAVWRKALAGDLAAQAQVQQAARHDAGLATLLRTWTAADAAPAPEPEPGPDAAIQLADGTQVPVYTADGLRQRDAWLRSQLAPELESRLMEKVQPLVSAADKMRQLEAEQAARQQSTQWAKSVIEPISRLPYFAEFKAELGKVVQGLPPTATDAEMAAAVYAAYTDLHTKKLESVTAQGASKAVADLQQRAVAGTTNPASANATTPRTFKPGVEGFEAALSHFAGSEAR